MKIKLYLILALLLLSFTCGRKEKKEAHGKNVVAVESTKTPNKEIFGFHPYWMGNTFKNYNYSLLSSIGYFAYDMDPYTGSYKTIRDWKTTPLIDSAKANNTKVYLTVTNFTAHNNRLFLKNHSATVNSIEVISKLLIERSAHGVIINFEDVSVDVKENYSQYISALSKELTKQNKVVVITMPSVDNSNSFDIKYLNKYVEYFIVLSKDYYGEWSEIAGPVAPLNNKHIWKEGSLTKSVYTYLENGMPRNKLILSVPYYGSKWETVSDSIPSRKTNFIGNLTYREIKKTYPKQPKYNAESESAYYSLIENKKNIQIWFDDATTLAIKYDYINKMGIAGVAIWALGYDDGYPELWKLLEEKFAKN